MRGSRSLRVAALAVAALAPCAARAGGGERFVLAWPPTRYESAELVLWRDGAGTEPLRVHVSGRGLDAAVEIAGPAAARVPLPREARCGSGLDACAIEATRVEGSDTFSVLLQSPDTNGAADTLLLTAHDTVRVPPDHAASTRHVVLSLPCAPATEMPLTASFVTVVPAAGAARVTAPAGSCAGAVDVLVAEGEALTLTCSGLGDDLTGLVLEADAPVVAFSGNVVTTVPVDPGRGLSGDLTLDLAGSADGAARFAALPLPRSAGLAGRGDIVRIAALEPARVRVHDDRGGVRDLVLAAGELADIDTEGGAADVALAFEADASVAAWHVPKSRALRGLGDPAAIPLVPSSRMTTRDRFFVPDGYAEANVVTVAAEPGARVLLDGVVVPLVASPGGLLDVARVDLPAPPAGGAMHELTGDAPFAAWVAGFGGYKAYGHAAAIAWPRPPVLPWLLRGERADDLQPLVPAPPGSFSDADVRPRLFWRLQDDSAVLRVARCGEAACLTW